MKKIILSLSVAVLLVNTPILAQKYNAESIKSKIEKSNESIANPKRAEKASTWEKRGAMFSDIALANSSSVFVGMNELILTQTIGAPTNKDNIPIENIGGVDYKKLEYPTVDIYLTVENPQVTLWLEKTEVEPKAVELALEAYDKALALDPKSKSKVAIGYSSLVSYLTVRANNNYTFGNYDKASEYFKQAADLDLKNPEAPSADPKELLYFAAVASVQAEKNELAASILEDLIAQGEERDGEVYYYAGVVYERLKDKENAKKYLQIGVEKFLDNQRLLQHFISFSITNGEGADAVLPYIVKAQEGDPENPVFFIAEGIVYDQAKDYDKAIVSYKKAITLDEKSFGALYNLGFAYRSKAIVINEELAKVDYTNTKVITELRAEFSEAMNSAISPFERALAIEPENKLLVEVLRAIFFSLRDESPEMLAQYEKYNALFETM